MDKFIISLPRGNSKSKQKVGAKRPLSDVSVSDEHRSSFAAAPKNSSTFGRSRAQPSQSFLDLGQSSFGAHMSCKKCSMLYVIGDVDDEARHKSFCGKSKEALTLPNLKSFHTIEIGNAISVTEDCIVEVRQNEKHKIEQEPLRTILDTVQSELGSTLTLMEDSSESILLFVRAKKVIGCIIREAVESAKLISLSLLKGTVDVDVAMPLEVSSSNPLGCPAELLDEDDDANPKSHSFSASPSTRVKSSGKKRDDDTDDEQRPIGITMGIKLIWVFDKCRREGIACRLLDAARKSFEFGRIVKKDHVAYSQPTDSGLRLFLSYSKKENIWGYS